MPEARARAAAEWAARNCYGRLVAQLTARCGSLPLAEDALADAFASALSTWPTRGVPDKPEAWLMKAASRKIVDTVRRAATAARHAAGETPLLDEAGTMDTDEREAGDRRLELMFLCAHPALPEAAHTALMLQAVLGFSADEIARATLEAPATVSQRLTRAKRKLADGSVPFSLPPDHILRERMAAVERAIYTAYASGWEDVPGGANPVTGLAAEAEWLARCLVQLAPNDAEAKGLLALILYCESRRAARRDQNGRYVQLSRQDTSLWDTVRIAEATALLTEAGRMRAHGRFQLEAAIQAVHAARRDTGRTDWDMICQLYGALRRLAPSVGARIGHAAALLNAGRVSASLNLLGDTPYELIEHHAPFWAVRGHAMKAARHMEFARQDFERAAALTEDQALRTWLLAQRHDA